jgi:Mycoplasma protein of unknown function, DUF285/BspA type Leucine rich repeat region (6 copies)
MRRVPYIGPVKPQGELTGIYGTYDQYQLKQNGQWTDSLQPSNVWVRPSDWLAMPTVNPGDEKFVGLFGVWPFSYPNPVGIYCDVPFTVDWGDGTGPQNYAAGQAFYHYDFNSVDPATTTSKGYRQILITVIPQSSYHITNFSIIESEGIGSLYNIFGTAWHWLDVHINMPNLQNIKLGGGWLVYPFSAVNCERVIIGPSQITSTQNLFKDSGLQYLEMDTSHVTNFSYMFYNSSIKNAPYLDTSNGTTFDHMFASSAVETLPLYDTSSGTNFVYMFSGCGNLKTVPHFDTSNGKYFGSMFGGAGIDSIPQFDLSSAEDTSSMFAYSQLAYCPSLDMPNVTFAQNMFNYCPRLRTVGHLNLPLNTNFQSMFQNCGRLTDVSITTTSGQLFSSMFYGCTLLTRFPSIDWSNATDVRAAFNQSGITSVPDITFPLATNFSSMFAGTSGLYSVGNLLCNAGTDFSGMFYESGVGTIASVTTPNGTNFSQMFSGAELLKRVPTGLDLSNATDCTLMFNDCSILASIPDLNTSSLKTWEGMFQTYGTGTLQVIGKLDMSQATSVPNVFKQNYNLSNIMAYGCTISFSVDNCRLSQKNLGILFQNLGIASGASQSITITNNWGAANRNGANPVTTKTVTTTAGSSTLTAGDTNGLTAGMIALGTGISDPVAVTFTDAGDTVNLAGHGLSNGTNISFSSITSTTGINSYTVYYVVNAAANTFQVAATPGGSALPLTTDGSGTMLYPSFISSIVPNTSITLTAPASASGTVSIDFRALDISYATQKGWTVVG